MHKENDMAETNIPRMPGLDQFGRALFAPTATELMTLGMTTTGGMCLAEIVRLTDAGVLEVEEKTFALGQILPPPGWPDADGLDAFPLMPPLQHGHAFDGGWCFGPSLTLTWQGDQTIVSDAARGRELTTARRDRFDPLLTLLASVLDALAVHRIATGAHQAIMHGRPWWQCAHGTRHARPLRATRAEDAVEMALWELAAGIGDAADLNDAVDDLGRVADELGDGCWTRRIEALPLEDMPPGAVHPLLLEAAGRWRATRLRPDAGAEREAVLSPVYSVQSRRALLDADHTVDVQLPLVDLRCAIGGTLVRAPIVLWPSEVKRVLEVMSALEIATSTRPERRSTNRQRELESTLIQVLHGIPVGGA
jgi:hypothetical protein